MENIRECSIYRVDFKNSSAFDLTLALSYKERG
jgi:hypothetical protein